MIERTSGERTPDAIHGADTTSRTLLCKTRASSYSISNMVAGARARLIGLLVHANKLLANGTVNKSYRSSQANKLSQVQRGRCRELAVYRGPIKLITTTQGYHPDEQIDENYLRPFHHDIQTSLGNDNI